MLSAVGMQQPEREKPAQKPGQIASRSLNWGACMGCTRVQYPQTYKASHRARLTPEVGC